MSIFLSLFSFFFFLLIFLFPLMLICLEYLVCWNLLLIEYMFLLISIHQMETQALKAYLIIQTKETLFLRHFIRFFFCKEGHQALKGVSWPKC